MIHKLLTVLTLLLISLVPSIALGTAETKEDSDIHWLWVPNTLVAAANVVSSVSGRGRLGLGAIGLVIGSVSVVEGWRVSDEELFATGILAASAGVVSLVLWRRDRGKSLSEQRRLNSLIRWADGPKVGVTLKF
jgi:hypothetical protein